MNAVQVRNGILRALNDSEPTPEFQHYSVNVPRVPVLAAWIHRWWPSDLEPENIVQILRVYHNVMVEYYDNWYQRDTADIRRNVEDMYNGWVRQLFRYYGFEDLPQLHVPRIEDVWEEVKLFTCPLGTDSDWMNEVSLFLGRKMVNSQILLFRALRETGGFAGIYPQVTQAITEQPICNRLIGLEARIRGANSPILVTEEWIDIARDVMRGYAEDGDTAYELYLSMWFFVEIALRYYDLYRKSCEAAFLEGVPQEHIDRGVDPTPFSPLFEVLREIEILVEDPLSILPLELRERLAVIDYFSYCVNFISSTMDQMQQDHPREEWEWRIPQHVMSYFLGMVPGSRRDYFRIRRNMIWAHHWPDPMDDEDSQESWGTRFQPYGEPVTRAEYAVGLTDDPDRINEDLWEHLDDFGPFPWQNNAEGAANENSDEDDEMELAEDVQFEPDGPPLDISTFTTPVALIPANIDCTVCLESFSASGGESGDVVVRTSCGHCFHSSCLDGSVNGAHDSRNLCPNCRAEICAPRPRRPIADG